MITLLLMGGLGNQLFQYAFARSLALILQNDARINISRRFFLHDDYGREYSLDKLSLPEDVRLMSHSQELITHSKFYLARKLHFNRSFYSGRYIYLNAKDFDLYEPALFSQNYSDSNTIINGYFQNVKYFREHESIIKRELRVSMPPSPANQDKINELSSCQSVCVHVRRGDYLSLKGGQLCGYEYYSRAMHYIAGRINSPVFYFFSNTSEDINWLKTHYDFHDFNVKYIELDNPDYEELRLMYSCRHFIIANSTLSWWGSYLSDNPSKIICAPSKWLDERKIESTGLYHSGLSVILIPSEQQTASG